MKILLLADEAEPGLWEHLDKRRLEGVGLILACGDLPAAYLSFLTCFTSAPILYIHGNHDGRYEITPPEGCTCVDGMVCVCQGIRILGLGGSMWYNGGAHQYKENRMRARIRKLRLKLLLSGGFDILMTHAPARGLGDDTDLAHRGFETFLRLIEKYHPDIMVHGHVHKNYRFDFKREREYMGTKIINGYGAYVIEYDPPAEKKGFFRRMQWLTKRI